MHVPDIHAANISQVPSCCTATHTDLQRRATFPFLFQVTCTPTLVHETQKDSWSLDSLPTRFLRRTGHGMLRDWNMDKVHEVGWCIASALKATQRASKSSWFLACSSCFPVWPFAELLDESCSFSDFVCMLCSALRGGSVRKNPKHTASWDMGR